MIVKDHNIEGLSEDIRKAYNNSHSNENHENVSYWGNIKSYGFADQIRNDKEDKPHRNSTRSGHNFSEDLDNDFLMQREMFEIRKHEEAVEEKKRIALYKALKKMENEDPGISEFIFAYYKIIGRKKSAYAPLAREFNITSYKAKKDLPVQ